MGRSLRVRARSFASISRALTASARARARPDRHSARGTACRRATPPARGVRRYRARARPAPPLTAGRRRLAKARAPKVRPSVPGTRRCRHARRAGRGGHRRRAPALRPAQQPRAWTAASAVRARACVHPARRNAILRANSNRRAVARTANGKTRAPHARARASNASLDPARELAPRGHRSLARRRLERKATARTDRPSAAPTGHGGPAVFNRPRRTTARRATTQTVMVPQPKDALAWWEPGAAPKLAGTAARARRPVSAGSLQVVTLDAPAHPGATRVSTRRRARPATVFRAHASTRSRRARVPAATRIRHAMRTRRHLRQ